MFLSVLAGMMISIGCIVYLTVEGPLGAFLFSVGLLSVLVLRFELFTGKAGLYASNSIRIGKLIEIWWGNLCGAIAMAFGIAFTPIGMKVAESAMAVVKLRIENGFMVNLAYGVLCGILMYLAVTLFKASNGNPLYAIMPVMIFILCGFNHCIADIFYTAMGSVSAEDWMPLISTTIGNFIGCNAIPYLIEYDRWERNGI